MLNNTNDIVILIIKSLYSTSERRLSKSSSISSLYQTLTPITGKVLQLSLGNTILDLEKKLGYYSPQDYDVLDVIVEKSLDYNNVDQVEKVVMEDEEYEKRNDSVRAFKKRLGLGRYRVAYSRYK
jgi:tubulin-specific chaperone B